MGYSFQQAEEDLPLAADALEPPPRKKVPLVPTLQARKKSAVMP